MKLNNHQKLLIFVIIVALIAQYLVVTYYERRIASDNKIKGGRKIEYTADDILTLIKKSPEYIGDSVVIYEDGTLVTNNAKFQGTINSVLSVQANVDGLKQETASNKLPYLFNVYKLAAYYYRGQYPEEFKPKPISDSTASKK
jgi:hypothetical protein